MMQTIYNMLTGQIVSTTNRTFGLDLPENFGIIPGSYNAETQYIDAQGQPQDLPQPPQDGQPYKFDWATKTYVPVSQTVTADSQRDQRNALLAEIDRISATRFASLTESQQQELQDYRQALLDVPQQAGFPESVTWPTKPDWL
jgi:hypothetical protein